MGRLVIFNIGPDTSEQELGDYFDRFGELTRVAIRDGGRGDRGLIGFIDYRRARDAAEAYHHLNRSSLRGFALRIEYERPNPNGAVAAREAKGGGKGSSKHIPYGKGADMYGPRGPPRAPRGPPPDLNRMATVAISGIPNHASQQDLKDFLRLSGRHVKFAEVDGCGQGTGGYADTRDAEDAARDLDGRDLRARDGVLARVRVRVDRRYSPSRERSDEIGGDRAAGVGGGGGGVRSRSRSPRGRSLSPGGPGGDQKRGLEHEVNDGNSPSSRA